MTLSGVIQLEAPALSSAPHREGHQGRPIGVSIVSGVAIGCGPAVGAIVGSGTRTCSGGAIVSEGREEAVAVMPGAGSEAGVEVGASVQAMSSIAAKVTSLTTLKTRR